MCEKERREAEKKSVHMSKEMDFFIFLLERYARHKNTTADKVLAYWDELQITDFIFGMYEIYHVERIENAFDDIDEIIRERTENR